MALILRLSSDPDGQMRSLLAKGASAALAAISRVLEQAVDALEQRAVSSPRTARRPVRTVVDSVEALLVSMDERWCECVSASAEDDLRHISKLLVAIPLLAEQDTSSLPELTSAVSELLEALARCTSVAVYSVSVLDAPRSDANARIRVLESLRGLSEQRQESVSGDEAAAFERVFGVLKAGRAECEHDVFVSACMAAFTLCCRGGLLYASVEVLSLYLSQMQSWVEAAKGGNDATETISQQRVRELCAIGALIVLSFEMLGKVGDPALRVPIEAAGGAGLGKVAKSAKSLVTMKDITSSIYSSRHKCDECSV